MYKDNENVNKNNKIVNDIIVEILLSKYDNDNPNNLYDKYANEYLKVKNKGKYDDFEAYLRDVFSDPNNDIVKQKISTEGLENSSPSAVDKYIYDEYGYGENNASVEEFKGGLYKGFPRDDRRKNDRNKLPDYYFSGNTVKKDTGYSAFQEYKMRVNFCMNEMKKLRDSRVRINNHTLGVVNRKFILGKTSLNDYLGELELLKAKYRK